MSSDGIRCHQMSYEGLERMLKQQEKKDEKKYEE